MKKNVLLLFVALMIQSPLLMAQSTTILPRYSYHELDSMVIGTTGSPNLGKMRINGALKGYGLYLNSSTGTLTSGLDHFAATIYSNRTDAEYRTGLQLQTLGTTLVMTGLNNSVSGTATEMYGYLSSVSSTGADTRGISLEASTTSTTGNVTGGQFAASNFTASSNGIIKALDATATGIANTTTYGIYASASGGATNYAGYFVGNSYMAGNLTVTGTITNPSDEKLKKNVVGIENALQKVMRLNPSVYEFKDEYRNANFDTKPHFGFTAQNVGATLPQLVYEAQIVTQHPVKKGKVTIPAKEEKILTVNYLEMIPILTKAIQEQQQIIEALKAEVELLKKNK